MDIVYNVGNIGRITSLNDRGEMVLLLRERYR